MFFFMITVYTHIHVHCMYLHFTLIGYVILERKIAYMYVIASLKRQYHDQSRLSTGHGIDVLIYKMNTVTKKTGSFIKRY